MLLAHLLRERSEAAEDDSEGEVMMSSATAVIGNISCCACSPATAYGSANALTGC